MKFNRIERSARSLAVVCSTVVLAFGASTANAETEALTYRLSAIQDAAYGRMILADDFESAIDRLEDRSRRGIPGFFAATNLCVAYIKTGDLELAETSCAAAVEEITALVEARNPGYGEATDSMAVRRFMAMALSNRGVARALKGQHDLAAADFEKAIDIKSRLAEPAINLARLERVVTTGA